MTDHWTNSPVSVAIRKARRMVALSDAFQTRAAIDYDTAASRVWTEYAPANDELIADTDNPAAVEVQRPLAALWPISVNYAPASGGSQVWLMPQGMLHLYLNCGGLETITDWNERREEAIGFLDQWLADILNLSGADDPDSTDGLGHLTIKGADVVLIDHTPRETRDTTGDIYYQMVSLNFGDDY